MRHRTKCAGRRRRVAGLGPGTALRRRAFLAVDNVGCPRRQHHGVYEAVLPSTGDASRESARGAGSREDATGAVPASLLLGAVFAGGEIRVGTISTLSHYRARCRTRPANPNHGASTKNLPQPLYFSDTSTLFSSGRSL